MSREEVFEDMLQTISLLKDQIEEGQINSILMIYENNENVNAHCCGKFKIPELIGNMELIKDGLINQWKDNIVSE